MQLNQFEIFIFKYRMKNILFSEYEYFNKVKILFTTKIVFDDFIGKHIRVF